MQACNTGDCSAKTWRHEATGFEKAQRLGRRLLRETGFAGDLELVLGSEDSETAAMLRAVGANGSTRCCLNDDGDDVIVVSLANTADATLGTAIEEFAHAIHYGEQLTRGRAFASAELVVEEEIRAKRCILALADRFGVCPHGVAYAHQALAALGVAA